MVLKHFLCSIKRNEWLSRDPTFLLSSVWSHILVPFQLNKVTITAKKYKRFLKSSGSSLTSLKKKPNPKPSKPKNSQESAIFLNTEEKSSMEIFPRTTPWLPPPNSVWAMTRFWCAMLSWGARISLQVHTHSRPTNALTYSSEQVSALGGVHL